MATDRSLATLLRALQSPSSDQDAARLLASATTLFTFLANPLNITLLTFQILSAPAIWHDSDDNLRATLRVLSTFNSAGLSILRNGTAQAQPFLASEGLPIEDWMTAVVKGADERTPRWKHLLVLGGLLTGFEAHDRRGLSLGLRQNLEAAIVTATNLALNDTNGGSEVASRTVCMVLGHVFDILSDHEKARLDHNRLLPLLVQSVYFSKDGLYWGYFVGAIDPDIIQGKDNKFDWPVKSTSFVQLQRLATGPLVSALGPLSRLTAFCVESVTDVRLLFRMIEDLSAFTRSISIQWRQNKLSELDSSEETTYLDQNAMKLTFPLMWQVLKSLMFSVVIIQGAVLGRMLGDRTVPQFKAPFIAIQTLQALRNIYFIITRLGHTSFSQFLFVYTTSIDILSQYPAEAEAFLDSIRPTHFGSIPDNPLERNLDLFFLNTAENFTLVTSPRSSEDLMIAAATPYLNTGSDPRLLEIFESAHSVVLAVFSAPYNYEVTVKHLPFYIDTVFQMFPQCLSSQQLRLALKTLVRITSPPNQISKTQPGLSSVVLEMALFRSSTASHESLPTPPGRATTANQEIISEQAAMVMALIDCLSSLSPALLDEWLPLVADAVSAVRGQRMQENCRARFWEVLSSGEMDVGRAERSIIWWNTKGGRELLLFGQPDQDDGPFMSGALPDAHKL